MILIYQSRIMLDCQDEDHFHVQLIPFGLFKTKGSQVDNIATKDISVEEIETIFFKCSHTGQEQLSQLCLGSTKHM